MNLRTASCAFVLCALPALAWAAPKGTVVLRNGTRFEDVNYEVRGKRVRVTLKYGERDFRMSEIKELVPNRDEAPAGAEEEGDTAGQDWLTRFRLIAPEGWEPVSVTTPLIRAQLKHSEYDATLSVSVRPAEGGWQEPQLKRGFRVNRDLGDHLYTDMSAFYGKTPKPKITVRKYFEAPVYRLSGVTVQGYRAARNQYRVNSEVRFLRYGLEYAVTYSVKKEDAGAMQHEVEGALASFSFLPAMSITEDSYSDYERGFAITRPREDWVLTSEPFHLTRPVRLRTKDKRGEVEVKIHYDALAETVVSKLLTQRKKNRHFVKRSAGKDTHRGSQVEAFSFEDFRSGGRRKLHYTGFAAQAGPNVVLVIGIAPLSDEDAKKIDGEVERTLKSVRLYDAGQIRDSMTKERDALRFVSQGYRLMQKKKAGEAVQRYDDAIAASDTFALAYFLRGVAKKAKGDFRGYEEDLTRADELDSAKGYADDLGDIAKAEADAAVKRRDWPKAVDLLVRSYRSSKDKAELKKLSNALTQRWNQYKKKGRMREGVDALDSKLKPLIKVGPIHFFLSNIYKDTGTNLLKKKDYSRAKKMAGKMKKLGKKVKNPKYTSAGKQLEVQIKRARDRR